MFTALNIGTYDYSYVDNTRKEEGQFEVVSPEPDIGRGFTVSSSMANSPPRLEEITYNNDRPFDNFRVMAIDPDDDEVYYYAFNVPMAISGRDNEGHRTWRPAATLAATRKLAGSGHTGNTGSPDGDPRFYHGWLTCR